jgi:hypothetical protein
VHDQRHAPEGSGERAVDGKAFLDVNQDESEHVEIEGVDDPSEEHRPERAPPLATDLRILEDRVGLDPNGLGGSNGYGLSDIASILIVVDAAPELEDERRTDHRELSTRKSMPGRPDDVPFVREWLDL